MSIFIIGDLLHSHKMNIIHLEEFFMARQHVEAGTHALRARDVAALLGISRGTVWLWAKEGRLPKGKKIAPRCTVWIREDIERFLMNAE